MKKNSHGIVSVLHLHSGNMLGGVESAIQTLAKHAGSCPELNQEIALTFDAEFATLLRQTGMTVRRLPEVQLRNPFSVLRSRAALSRLLQRNQFDVVLFHSPWSAVVFGPTPQHVGTTSVFMMHSPYTGHWLQRAASRHRPAFMLCNSLFTQASVGRIYPHSSSEVIYLPVEAPARVDREKVRHDLGVSDRTVAILMASRMEKWKGHLNLLQAALRLNARSEWVVLVAGAPQTKNEERYYALLQSETQRLRLSRRVRFLGQRSDIPALMQSCDIYCQPNETPEPFGMVYVEALRAGLPAVTFAMGGPVEILDERSGRLVEPGDLKGLTQALQTMIDDSELRARYREAGRARGEEMFDPERQLKKIYESLAKVKASQWA